MTNRMWNTPLSIEEQEEILKTKMLGRRNQVRKGEVKMSVSEIIVMAKLCGNAVLSVLVCSRQIGVNWLSLTETWYN